jgi:phage tail-like protein
MTQPNPLMTTRSSALARDLAALVRRYDPAWTASNDSDPGVTLLEVGAWLADWLGAGSTAPRPDPYRNFNFRVKLDGTVVAGVSRISALRRTADIVEHREGGAPQLVQRLPGKLVHEPFTLERPLGADTSFEDWADQVRDRAAGGAEGASPAWRKTVRIELLDNAGRLFLAYDVSDCWPSQYSVLPDLTESLTLVPDKWQRDRSVSPVA